MQPLKLAARLGAQLVVQQLARVPVGGERLPLSAGTVKGQHQGTVRALAVWGLPYKGRDLGDQLARSARSELHVEALLQRLDVLLVECGDGLTNGVAVDVGEGGSAPQVQCGPVRGGRLGGPAGAPLLLAPRRRADETGTGQVRSSRRRRGSR